MKTDLADHIGCVNSDACTVLRGNGGLAILGIEGILMQCPLPSSHCIVVSAAMQNVPVSQNEAWGGLLQ